MLHTLLIDNYDSYTYNLYQLLAVVNGAPPTVVRNDELTDTELQEQIASGRYHNIVISPGPGTPDNPKDIGCCLSLLTENTSLPILGVCLGHQALACAHGGKITRAPEPIHGRLSYVYHNNNVLFKGIPSGGSAYPVVRYHSLHVDFATLPGCLEATAWASTSTPMALQAKPSSAPVAEVEVERPTADTVLMGLAHRKLPHFGVQFHPESIGTAYGYELLSNFRRISADWHNLTIPTSVREVPSDATAGLATDGASEDGPLDVCYATMHGLLQNVQETEVLMQSIVGSMADDVFWLDSSATDRGRFSYFGGRGGRLWQKLTFHLAPPATNGQRHARPPGKLTIEDSRGRIQSLETHLLEHLEGALERHRCRVSPEAQAELPFDFWGGYVGYLGYEMKAECGAESPFSAATPDAALFLADRFVAVDNSTGHVYAVALHQRGEPASVSEAQAWVQEACDKLRSAAAPATGPDTPGPSDSPASTSTTNAAAAPMANGRAKQPNGSSSSSQAGPGPFQLRHSREAYLSNVEASLEAMRRGDSYEVCVTTALTRDAAGLDPRAFYRTLRRINPAAFSSYLSFGKDGPQVCSSSPERFLCGRRGGVVEARPIKGTAARSPDPAEDSRRAAALATAEKERAENLMIVDLLRNDLGRVCQVGSVHVPKLMEVESYSTIHNLVSTVQGRRRPGCSVIDCFRAAFPGGSMTGAPKLRTMQIIDELEGAPRGVYSGAIGFFSLAGPFDLNIVIRTAVFHAGKISIGAGGAVTVQSDPAAEFDEMKLKAQALLRAVGLCDQKCHPGAPVPAELREAAPEN